MIYIEGYTGNAGRATVAANSFGIVVNKTRTALMAAERLGDDASRRAMMLEFGSSEIDSAGGGLALRGEAWRPDAPYPEPES